MAVATGLTGSVTTFSSWQAAAMEAAVNFSFLTPSSPAGQVRARRQHVGLDEPHSLGPPSAAPARAPP